MSKNINIYTSHECIACQEECLECMHDLQSYVQECLHLGSSKLDFRKNSLTITFRSLHLVSGLKLHSGGQFWWDQSCFMTA